MTTPALRPLYQLIADKVLRRVLPSDQPLVTCANFWRAGTGNDGAGRER